MNNKRQVITAIAVQNSKFIETVFESSSESSDSDDDVGEDVIGIILEKMTQKIQPRKRKIPRMENYFEITIPMYSPKEFQSHFRITIEAYRELYRVLEPMMMDHYETGRPLKLIKKQILSVIWVLATPDSYRSVGDRFDMGESSLNDAFVRIVRALVNIAPRIIKWLREEHALEIQRRFRSIAGFDKIVGVMDGTYVPIKAPRLNAEVYVTQKSNYAMTLQAIAEPSLRFIDCFIGFPGSVSDARIFRKSYIYHEIEENYNNYFTNGSFILGDKAYPLLRWCIPPYIARRRLTPIENNFNTIHAKTRQVVERAFFLLFGRFRRLKYLDMNRTDMIPSTVIAACVLHNICLQHDDLLIEEYIGEGAQFLAHNNPDNEALDHEQFPNAAAANSRNQIALQLFNNNRRH